MKLTVLFGCLVFLPGLLHAQSVRSPVAASYPGMGAYSVQHVDVFSVTSNAASLAQIKDGAVGAYGERRFLLNTTNMYSAVIALPTKLGNFGFQGDYLGYKNYNESQLSLLYARSLGSAIDVGIKFNYFSFRIPGYQGSSAITFDIGAIAHLTDKLNAGINIYNPVGGTLSQTENEKLASIYTFGIGYEASDDFLVSAEIIKEENIPVNVKAGFQYNFLHQFFVRAGMSSVNSSPFAGAGISWNNLRLDISASYHPQLGVSPGVMLIYNFKKKVVEQN